MNPNTDVGITRYALSLPHTMGPKKPMHPAIRHPILRSFHHQADQMPHIAKPLINIKMTTVETAMASTPNPKTH